MNILHINSYYATTALYQHLYDRQIASGHSIDVYVPTSKQLAADKIKATGDYTTINRNFNQWERLIFHWKHYKILKDLKTQYTFTDYDLIHAHSLFSNGWLANQVARQYNIPYLVAVRSSDIRTFFAKMPWLRPMGIRILKEAEKIVFISRNAYHEVLENYIPKSFKADFIAKSQVIPNGIDHFWLEQRNLHKFHEFHRPLRIISVGRINSGKRFGYLADVVHAYNRNYGPIELHIVGPIESERAYNEFAHRPNVYYHGTKTKEELHTLFRRMDIFALLSSPETFGLVYVEAMSQGLPVIYSQGEGFDGFFKDHTVGVSVDIHDELAFCQAVDYIIRHYGQMVDNALVGSQFFDWDKINQRYLELYQEIITS